MSKRPWYSFYPADYARDTGDLTMVEHGAYRLLMDHYYSTGEPLSTDVERLLRLCRATVATEVAAVRFVLGKFFVLGPDGYRHDRIDVEITKAAEKAAKCSTAGTISATKRQQKSQHKSNGRSTDVATEVQPSLSQSQSEETNNKKEAPTLRADLLPAKVIHIQIPEWVPVEPWDAFCAMRKRIKKPLTPDALKVLLAKMTKLHDAGHDIGAVLEESVLNQWQSVFAPKPEGTHGKAPASKSFGSSVFRVVEERAARRAADQRGRSDGGTPDDGLEALLGGGNPQLRLADNSR